MLRSLINIHNAPTANHTHPHTRHIPNCVDIVKTPAVDMSFCTSLQNFLQIEPPSAEKNDVMLIFKMADLGNFFGGSNIGFFEKPMYN